MVPSIFERIYSEKINDYQDKFANIAYMHVKMRLCVQNSKKQTMTSLTNWRSEHWSDSEIELVILRLSSERSASAKTPSGQVGGEKKRRGWSRWTGGAFSLQSHHSHDTRSPRGSGSASRCARLLATQHKQHWARSPCVENRTVRTCLVTITRHPAKFPVKAGYQSTKGVLVRECSCIHFVF